jgi:hypothetical protein
MASSDRRALQQFDGDVIRQKRLAKRMLPRIMNTIRTFGMTGLALCLLLAAFMVAVPAIAQTGSAQLSISMKVQSSIGLVFNNNPSAGSQGFCPLGNAGSNAASLDLGNASYNGGDSLNCILFSQQGNFYVVDSAFDVLVTKSNTSSASYQLAAQISSVPPANVQWRLNQKLLSNNFVVLQSANNYGQPVTETLEVRVRNDVPAQTLQETITFLATAN